MHQVVPSCKHQQNAKKRVPRLGRRKRRASDYARVASKRSFLVGKRTSKLVSTTRMGFVGALLMVAGWVCVLAGLACALAWVLQDRFLYMPLVPGVISNRDPRDNEDPSLQSPVFYGLEFEEVFIQTPTPGVELHAWIIFAPAQGPPKSLPTVLFLHGNAGNIGHRLPFAEDVVLYGNCNIMLVDYRGFGRSTGAPSEEGLIEDGMSALSYLRECPDVDPENIFLMGRSLGGAVSIALASKLATRAGLDLGFRGLILENTFLSVPTLVRDHIRDTLSLDRGLMQELCTGAVNTVVWLDWNSASRIKALPDDLNVLLISGVLDEIVPSSHMTKLYALAGPNVVKTLLRIPGGDHNFSWARPGYFRGLKAFLHEKGKSGVPSSDTLGSQPLSLEK